MFDFFSMLGNYEDRKVGRWDSEDGERFVSTAEVCDGAMPLETAVLHPEYNGGKMVIVEAYSDREAATVGHEKWVALVIADALPNPLAECHNAQVSQLAEVIGRAAGMDDEERGAIHYRKAEGQE